MAYWICLAILLLIQALLAPLFCDIKEGMGLPFGIMTASFFLLGYFAGISKD